MEHCIVVDYCVCRAAGFQLALLVDTFQIVLIVYQHVYHNHLNSTRV